MEWQTREGAEAVSLAAVIYSSFTAQIVYQHITQVPMVTARC